MIKKISHLLLFIFTSINVFAQNTTNASSGGFFYDNNKLNVVIAVLSIILVGFSIKLILMDKKLSKLEKEIKE